MATRRISSDNDASTLQGALFAHATPVVTDDYQLTYDNLQNTFDVIAFSGATVDRTYVVSREVLEELRRITDNALLAMDGGKPEPVAEPAPEPKPSIKRLDYGGLGI
jgi:hypothetical protein